MIALWMVLAQVAPGMSSPDVTPGADLRAAAMAASRPPECTPAGRHGQGRGPSVWELARLPELRPYCDLLARAQAQLATAPDKAKALAAEADALLPGRATPSIVKARAELALHAVDAAAKDFARARQLDPRSLEEPATMHDHARVLVATKQLSDAIATYRALVPRVDLLPSEERRTRVLLEAAHVSMAVEAQRSEAVPAGTPGARSQARTLDEAIAYLREARQRGSSALTGDVALSLVLALDRSGNKAQADAALREADRTTLRPAEGALDYVTNPEDEIALRALALEMVDRAAAIKEWQRFSSSAAGIGPWAGAARGRLDALKKGSSPARTAGAPKRGERRR